MKVIKDEPATLKRPRRVTVEIAPDEKLMSVYNRHFYKLGYPLDDVVPAHVLDQARFVMWCPVAQEWVE